MRRREFLQLSVALTLQVFWKCDRGNPGRSSSPPNIVLILADDMGFSDPGCFGGEIATPHIDQLAKNGLLFTQFYNTARCSPSRASLLTGLYPHQTGVGHLATSQFEQNSYQGYLNNRCVTIAELLREAGYSTYMTGKWHVGTQQQTWPTRRGFDRFYGEHSYVDSYFYPTNQLYLDEEPIEPGGDNWYSTDAYTDYAIRFINSSQAGKPYFLYLAYNAPHFPLQAFREDMEKYEQIYKRGWDEIRQQRYERQKKLGIIEPDWRLPPRNPGAEGWHHPVPRWEDAEQKDLWEMQMTAYAAQIDRMDQNIGRLLETLRARNELENTLIIFLSDNGGCAEDWINERNPEGVLPGERKCMLAYGLPWAQVSNTPFRLFKRWVHEGGIATPGIVHWPDGLQHTGISREMCHVIDVMPTLLEIAGVDYPEFFQGNTIIPAEGQSLAPIFRTGSRTGHETMGWEHEGNRAFRNGDWKLVWRGRFREGPWELYNLADDRTELNDLSNEYPEKVTELQAGYNAWAERVGVIEWDTLTAGNKEG